MVKKKEKKDEGMKSKFKAREVTAHQKWGGGGWGKGVEVYVISGGSIFIKHKCLLS